MNNFKWLMQYIKKVKWLFTLSLCLLFLESAAIIASTGLQKYIIDDVFIDGNYDRLIPILVLFACSFILYAALFTLAPHTFHRIQARIRVMLTKDFMEYMRKIPVQSFQNERVTKFVHYLSHDVEQVAGTIGGYIPRTLQFGVSIIILSIVIFLSSPLLLFSVLIFSILYVVVGRVFGPLIRKKAKEVQDKKTALLIHIEEGIASTREVMAYNRLEWENKLYNRYFGRYFDAVLSEAKLANRQLFCSEPLKWGANLIVLGYGGYSVIQGSISVGLFIVVYQFTSQLMGSLQQLFAFSMELAGKNALIDRLRTVMDGPTENDGVSSLHSPYKEIRFDQVSFTYHAEDDHYVLKDLSFTIPVGKKVAFVGTSGGGKSTIAQLLIRFIHPSKGQIYVNDTSLEDLKYNEWLHSIGIVPQDPYIFPDTVRNNIIMGREHISEQQMIDMCKIAGIHDYFLTLPEGYDTEIGERGITLSGGQRQRLALARAIVNNPDILILDEATSALDLETERQVKANLDTIRSGKTTIMIAHRLSTIQNADIIFVIDTGRIVEQGTHETLMKENTLYKELVVAEKNLEQGA
ncbi:ABC transporter ATP-binding protein [Bacillus salitolerans]|uniref:ABC transporter ATP-binding protein n=1 Tax=Bacillus salitolerans TaxID=1437434 RepID=A0ABW4LRJ7_9BACI